MLSLRTRCNDISLGLARGLLGKVCVQLGRSCHGWNITTRWRRFCHALPGWVGDRSGAILHVSPLWPSGISGLTWKLEKVRPNEGSCELLGSRRREHPWLRRFEDGRGKKKRSQKKTELVMYPTFSGRHSSTACVVRACVSSSARVFA